MAISELDLIWNPEWLHEHESLWSVMGKAGIANYLPVAEMLWPEDAFELNGNMWVPPNKQQVLLLLNALKVPTARARNSFLWDFAHDSSDQALISHAVRYCPSCLHNAFHAALFQFMPLVRCPIHDEPLLDYCPHCAVPISPSVGFAWRCLHCGITLTAFSRAEWIQAFKKGPPSAVFGELQSVLLDPKHSWSDSARRCLNKAYLSDSVGYHDFAAGDCERGSFLLEASPYEGDYYYWAAGVRACALARWHFEERIRLLRTLVAPHIRCCGRELPNLAHQLWPGLAFRCPVAAAIMQSAAYAGIPWSGDEWVNPGRRMANTAQENLVPELFDPKAAKYLNEEAAALVMRALARAALTDALESFIGTQETGKGAWHPPNDGLRYQVHWSVKQVPGGWRLDLETNATISAIQKLLKHSRCRGARVAEPAAF